MREINIFIEPHAELPDERALVEILVEQLNEAMVPMGLRIARVEWEYGDDITECRDAARRVSTEESFRFRLSGDDEIRMVQFVLQLQVSLNALYRDMVAVGENSELEVLEKPVLSLRKLPFVCNTQRGRKIMEKVRQAEEKDYSMDVLLEEFFRSEGKEKSDRENSNESHKKEKVAQEMKALTKLATALIHVAFAVVRMSRSTVGPRWQKAEELFWKGEYEAALAVLELPKIKAELRKAAREGDRTTGENLIGEAIFRIRLLQVDALDWDQRKAVEREIVSIYKTCITCGRSCLPKMALAGLMTEYAAFLEKNWQERRSWLVYERVIPLWRSLTEEDPLSSLPELASALTDFSDVLAYDFDFTTPGPKGDNVYRERTSERLLKEALDIYRLLVEENSDAVLPLWAVATYKYGELLLRHRFAQRAMNAYSDALDLYRILAERYPERYESLLEECSQAAMKEIQSYNSYYENKGDPEDAEDLLLAAEHDHPEAQFQLGKLYQQGEGVICDYDVAKDWYTRAAENGYVEAQRCMGYNCMRATLGWYDMKAAEKWFRMAAMQGDAQSQFELAKICMSRNNQQGYDEALYWIHEAEENADDGESYFMLGQYYENATGEQQSYEKAAYWYRKGDDDPGDLRCTYHLGKLYHYGKGVPRNCHEALRCYVEVRTWGLCYFSYREVQKQIDLLMKDWKN
jgi:TPR repeat protein